MLYRNKLILLFCLALAYARVQAQAGSDAAIPLLNASSLAFSPELERSNYVNAGVDLETRFDDNALNTTSARMSNLQYSFMGSIALDQSRARLRWQLEYEGGELLNQ